MVDILSKIWKLERVESKAWEREGEREREREIVLNEGIIDTLYMMIFFTKSNKIG